MVLLGERLIEERARSDLDLIAIALAQPGEMRGELAACLVILKVAVQTLLKELRRIAEAQSQSEERAGLRPPTPTREIEP